ncbi:uncharacterized protein At4g00950-like [Momordica charantia]|uniref:Uncharacterized protein At4g00950-like n=1 Tax=Momordica charantia TaxID=3673 RepID=A0A6J1DV06_MOMCH|nr:uncharacterized protein At4g00950-like [Momordica charantia]
MWSEPPHATEPSSTPTLSLSQLLPEPPWMPTPPRLTLASIPFLWEEAPGKPRQCAGSQAPPSPPLPPGERTLELPPRLQTALPSPTTVLDGPEIRRAGGSNSKRWGSFRKCKEIAVAGGGGGRLRRKRNVLLSVSSYSKSHFLVSIYERFKQVVTVGWRRR